MNPVVQLQKAGTLFAHFVPLKITDQLAKGLGLLFYYSSKKKREYIGKNLSYIFSNQEVTQEQFNYYVRRTFINFARMMVDFFRLSHFQKEDFDVERVGIENAWRALESNKGCVLLTLHLGNWDYAGAYLAANDLPISALVEETEPEMLALYTRQREHTGMKTFSIKRAGFAFLDTIKNNRVLAILGDRDIAKNGITTEFFSGKRKIPRGLADVIVKRRIPVVFAYIAFNPPQKEHRYIGVIEPPFVFEGSIDEFNQLMVRKFETIIRKYPDQWLVFHDEWIE